MTTPAPRHIPQPSPIGTAIAFVLGVTLAAAGLLLAATHPPLSGATIAATVLILTGCWVLRAISRTS